MAQAGRQTPPPHWSQPFVFDGKQLYSGINGLVRVGPGRQPKGQRLFHGPVVQVLAADDRYVCFQTDGRIWRLPK